MFYLRKVFKYWLWVFFINRILLLAMGIFSIITFGFITNIAVLDVFAIFVPIYLM